MNLQLQVLILCLSVPTSFGAFRPKSKKQLQSAVHLCTKHRSKSNNKRTPKPATKSWKQPSLVVFDLDDTIWPYDMLELDYVPQAKDAVYGNLNGKGRGVIGVRTEENTRTRKVRFVGVGIDNDRNTVKMFPRALKALQAIHESDQQHVRLAVISSAKAGLEVQIANAVMDLLEVSPGVTFKKLLLTHGGGFGDDRNIIIGSSPPLSANKAISHFPQLSKTCNVTYDEMLYFFDRSIIVPRLCEGVVAQRVQQGLTVEIWAKAMRKFYQEKKHQKSEDKVVYHFINAPKTTPDPSIMDIG